MKLFSLKLIFSIATAKGVRGIAWLENKELKPLAHPKHNYKCYRY